MITHRGETMTMRQRAREFRKELVHAAGCSYRGGQFMAQCATRDGVAENIADYLDACIRAGVRPRIPRSLRHIEPKEGW